METRGSRKGRRAEGSTHLMAVGLSGRRQCGSKAEVPE